MKKIFAILLSLCMILSLAACAGQGTETTADKGTPSATTQPPETVQPTTSVPETSAPAPTEEPFEETFLEREPGTKQLTLYWTKAGAKLETSDVWIWWEGKEGNGVLFSRCAYGFKCQVNVPEAIQEVGFIVRTACSDPGGSSWGEATKDYDGDRFAQLEGEETFIYLKSGDGNQYHSSDGGKTLEQIKSFNLAGIISENEIQYFINPAARLMKSHISVYDGEEKLEIAELSSEKNNVITGVIKMAKPLDPAKNYRVEIEGYGSVNAMPTGLFDSADFIQNYTYDGDDLGAVILEDGSIQFKVWAPTCSQVVLNRYPSGDPESDKAFSVAYEPLPMEKQEKGVWSLTVPASEEALYYTYTVTNSLGTNEVVDPYAKAVGVNGNRGMVVDPAAADPEGFKEDHFVESVEKYSDAVIWEVHVRDFSNQIASSQYPGKYLAFTETGLTNAAGVPVGVDYLKWLGISHVHLQPVYDFATVDESSSEAQFNWGYDPKNYNVPEGSYSTDPYHGEVRINEFKQMVQALHAQGLGVVMDVVYNHTYDGNSNLNRIVPYYYYRYDSKGTNSNGSGCGNETASDRIMFRKFMVDSVSYWAKEYHIDGFRFDLMALHDIETMQAIEKALHAINPGCLIYGEGWTGGTTPLRSNLQASQANIKQVIASEGAAGSVAVFNDAIRDGLKGSVFDAKGTGYINGTVNSETAHKVGFGLTGGAKGVGASWSVDDAMVINYMSCHDNLTLWDKLAVSCPNASQEEKLAMNRLGASVVMISRGTPFFLAGEEMLRSKDGDENSYKSSDAVNNIDWEALVPGSDAMSMAEFYRALILLRKEHPFLRRAEVSYEAASDGVLTVHYSLDGTEVAKAIINPTGADITVTTDGTILLGEENVVKSMGVTLFELDK